MTYTHGGERYHGEPTAEQPRQRTQAAMWGPPACSGDGRPGDRERCEEIRSIIATLAAAMTVSTSDRAGTVPSQERVCLPERHTSQASK